MRQAPPQALRLKSSPVPISALSCFAVCAPGLEPFTALELRGLNLIGSAAAPGGPSEMEGGIAFEGGLRALYQANLHLRTASRILVRVGAFYAAAFSELRKKASRLPWERYLTPGRPVVIRVTCHKSKLYHSDAVAERLAGALQDRLGQSLPRQKPPADADETATDGPLIVARLDHDRCTLSIDASGALLHQRGYRLAVAKAPLRETLAAGLLLASEWDTQSPLLDPFCGSGTIAIEAACLAHGLAPGRARQFAFMDWPGFDAGQWGAVLAEAEARRVAAGPVIQASDRDAGAIAAARDNAARAGVAEAIEFSTRAVSAITPPPGPGWIVTNPPYGVRVSNDQDLRNLYARLGQVLRARCPGWHVALLTSDLRLALSTRLRFDSDRTVALVNGGLKVKLAQGEVQASETEAG